MLHLMESRIAFQLILLFTGVHSRWILEVGVHRYINPDSRSVGNINTVQCCDTDGHLDNVCTNQCDNYFLFCLQDIDETAADSCPYGEYGTDVLGGDDLTFEIGEKLSAKVPNPLVFYGEEWPENGHLRFRTRVYDFDPDNEDDFVSTMILDGIFTVSDVVSRIYQVTGLYNEIQVDFHLYCAVNYYGSQCNVSCEPKDGEEGHYTCDSQGNIVCLEGYVGEESNCTSLFKPTSSSISSLLPSLIITSLPTVSSGSPLSTATGVSSNISPVPTLTESNETAVVQSTQLNMGVIVGVVVVAVVLLIVGVVVSVIIIVLISRKRRKYPISNYNDTGSSSNQLENPNYSPSCMGSHANLTANYYSACEDDDTIIRNVENPLYGKTNNEQESTNNTGYETIGNDVLLNSIKEEKEGNNYLLDVSTKVDDSEDIYYSTVNRPGYRQKPVQSSSIPVEGVYYSDPPNVDDPGLYEYTATPVGHYVPAVNSSDRDSQYEHYEFDPSYKR